MAHLQPASPAPFGAISVYRLVTAFERLQEAWLTRQHKRAANLVLRTLSARQLQDIGYLKVEYPGDLIR